MTSRPFEATRDARGIPQISGPNIDALYYGMGYFHARDRGLQMLLMRVLASGRASELLDDSDEMVEVDRFFRRLDFRRGLDAEIAKLEPDVADAVTAYCAGVNDRFAEKVPWEFKLVGYRPEPWAAGDSISLARVIGYVGLAQSQGEVERLIVQMVQAGVSDELLDALFPGIAKQLDRDIIEPLALGERIVPPEVQWATAPFRTMASNNWCVSGERSSSGRPLLANDPHLETNRLPNVWVEQTFEWPGGHAQLVTMPGIPGPLVGRNRALSWGATYTFMDAIDSWVEEARDGRVRRGDAWVEPVRREEVIRRKKSPPVTMVIWETDRGTVDGDLTVDGFHLATKWASDTAGAESVNALYEMWEADSVTEGMAAFARLEPSFNWIFADAGGDIGYQMSGRMPQRSQGRSGLVPRPAWDPESAWRGTVPQSELPKSHNPDDGIIVTANDDLNHLGEANPINMPMGDYRARRVRQLLLATEKHDVDSFRRMQTDVYSIQAEEFMEVLRPLLKDGPVSRKLAQWDLCYDGESEGATAFELFYEALFSEMFGSVLGPDVIDHLRGKTGIFIDFYQNFDRLLTADGSPWHAGRTRSEIWSAALARVDHLTPEPWGSRNRIPLTNMFFSGKLPRFFGFDRGPIVLRGGRATIQQGQIYFAGERMTSFAPSLRLVADMGSSELHTSLCGGPSDRRFSKHYDSDTDAWLAGRLTPRE